MCVHLDQFLALLVDCYARHGRPRGYSRNSSHLEIRVDLLLALTVGVWQGIETFGEGREVFLERLVVRVLRDEYEREVALPLARRALSDKCLEVLGKQWRVLLGRNTPVSGEIESNDLPSKTF